jgi:hypothetical protein
VFCDCALESLSNAEAGGSASERAGQFYGEVGWRIWLESLKSLVFSKAVFRLGSAKVYDVMANSVAQTHFNCKLIT